MSDSMSQKSKVQSPKSEGNRLDSRTRDSSQLADFGLSTLDLGLTVTDMRKSFLSPSGERIEVLRGVSFSAAAGETIAMVGASGAGKSTLLHLIGGIEVPDHGNIRLGEFAVEQANRVELAHYRSRRVGFVFQFHHLLSDLTAAENVGLPLTIARHDAPKAMRLALEALDRLGLAARSSHRVNDLSGGEQQRVAVCRALITQPVLVLADEPTGNLDANSGARLADDLFSYAATRPAIVIIATHNQDLAQRCDRRLTLKQGRTSEN
ncbi:MAG: ABC transporter ATP-binding protein [Pyrinomonadaceae bacterium]